MVAQTFWILELKNRKEKERMSIKKLVKISVFKNLKNIYKRRVFCYE